MSEHEYLHTKPRGGHKAHIYPYTEEATTGGYTEESLTSLCGGKESYGRFYTGRGEDVIREEAICGNCRKVMESGEVSE